MIQGAAKIPRRHEKTARGQRFLQRKFSLAGVHVRGMSGSVSLHRRYLWYPRFMSDRGVICRRSGEAVEYARSKIQIGDKKEKKTKNNPRGEITRIGSSDPSRVALEVKREHGRALDHKRNSVTLSIPRWVF